MNKNVIAAFDFDGTITYRDSLVYFLYDTAGPIWFCLNILRQLPSLILYLFGFSSRQKTKESLLRQFFAGIPKEQFEELGKQFANNHIPRLIRPEAKDRIDWHLSQGHTLILISASIDTYLSFWAKANGFSHSLTSRIEYSRDGLVTGNLIGNNCRREEKVARLTDTVGPKEHYTLYAYGDSQGDKELLEYADHPFYRKMS